MTDSFDPSRYLILIEGGPPFAGLRTDGDALPDPSGPGVYIARHARAAA